MRWKESKTDSQNSGEPPIARTVSQSALHTRIALSCVFPWLLDEILPLECQPAGEATGTASLATQVAQRGGVKVGCLGFAGAGVAPWGWTFAPCHADATTTTVRWTVLLCQGHLPWLLWGRDLLRRSGRESIVKLVLAQRLPAWHSLKQSWRQHGAEATCPLVFSTHERVYAEVLMARVPKMLHPCCLSGFLLAAWAETNASGCELDKHPSLTGSCSLLC